MNEPGKETIEKRIARLENMVAAMQNDIRRIYQSIADMRSASRTSAASRVSSAQSGPEPESASDGFRYLLGWKVEDWLDKIGIGLLLLSVAFLYKYSLDREWIIPAIALGAGLLFLGLYLHSKRRSLGHVLLGGSIATLYITVYSAFHLYRLINHPTAFALMAGVTLLAFVLSFNKNAISLSMVGIIGGLATPFLLHAGSRSTPWLAGYASLILILPAVLYIVRGWRSTHMISVVFGWAVFFLALRDLRGPESLISDRAALQAGIAFAWLIFWAIPVWREALHARKPERWPFPKLRRPEKDLPGGHEWFARHHAHILTVATPLVALLFTDSIWGLSGNVEGLITIAISLLYGLIFFVLNGERTKALGHIQGITAIILLTIGFVQIFSGNALLLILAAEAAALHYIAKKWDDRTTGAAAHFLYIFLGVRLFARLLLTAANDTAIINTTGMTYLIIMASGFLISYHLRKDSGLKIYRTWAQILFLAWIARQFSIVTDGQGYTTIAWGIYAIILILLAYRMQNRPLRIAAIATLMLVLGKLFVVDLKELEVIWRILLFFGFGGLLLILSYYLPGLWKSTTIMDDETDAA